MIGFRVCFRNEGLRGIGGISGNPYSEGEFSKGDVQRVNFCGVCDTIILHLQPDGKSSRLHVGN